MRIFITCLFIIMAGMSGANALSCLPVDDQRANEIVTSAHLIAKANIVHISPAEDEYNNSKSVKFQILDIYKDERGENPQTLTAHFSNFMDTWGPSLEVGQTGEYLFTYKDDGWHYYGPGGCNYLPEESWEKLRQKSAVQ